ncbi:MAG: DNA-binding domain-containing protein [Pseudomonadota bacterium]
MNAQASPRTGEAALAEALLAPKLPAPKSIASPQRFSVYRNNVVVSLIDAIAATFPAVHALVGDEFFRAAAREFVLGNPPSSPVLLNYGEAFPAWIAAFPPAATVPYLGDVARLEWAWTRAYHAADASPLTAARLADLPPERLLASRAVVHPSMALIASRFPVVSLWAQATRRRAKTSLDLTAAETALVARPGDVVDARAISPAMAAFLQALTARETIGAAIARLEDDQTLAGECLAGVFELGLAVDLVPEDAGGGA